MPTVGTSSKPAYVYDAGTDTWIPIGPGEHTHAYVEKSTLTTTGDLVYASSANTPARLGIGSTGQVLTVSGGVPAWGTASGGMTELASGSLSGSALSLTSISGSYIDLVFVLLDFWCSSDSGINFKLNNSGNIYSDTNRVDNVGITQASAGLTATFDNTDGNNFLYLQIPQYTQTTANKMAYGYTLTKRFDANGNYNMWPIWYAQLLTDAVNRIDISCTGTFSGGTYKLYGVK